MYTSVQARSFNAKPASAAPRPVNVRWALNLPGVAMKQLPIVNEDHQKSVISMREHVMPLMKRYKEEMPTHVRNLLSNLAWTSVVTTLAEQSGSDRPRYAGSKALEDEVKEMGKRLWNSGYRTVKVYANVKGSLRQVDSLVMFLEDCGLRVNVIWTGHAIFSKYSLVVGVSPYIENFFDVSYHLDGPKSVPDVEGNDTVFEVDFKATVNHSEAVGVVSWKNYNSFSL